MICLSQIICENCSHCDDAEINIAKKARTNLGLDTLQLDRLEVTPTNTKESLFPLGDEPGNPANSTAKQLRCVTVKSVKVKKKQVRNKRKSSQPEPPEIGIQLDLFSSLDGDDEELAS